jgi:hypothetical protein
MALRHRDIDLDASRVRVRASVAELRDGSRITRLPKSRASVRTMAAAVILPELRLHLDVRPDPMWHACGTPGF